MKCAQRADSLFYQNTYFYFTDMNVAIQPQLQTDRRDDPVLSGFCITEETSRSRTTTLEKTLRVHSER